MTISLVMLTLSPVILTLSLVILNAVKNLRAPYSIKEPSPYDHSTCHSERSEESPENLLNKGVITA